MNKLDLYERVPTLENNFTVKLRRYDKQHRLLAHWHEHVELLYFLEGECAVTIDGERYNVSAGDLAVVNPAAIHAFETESSVSYYCTLVYPELMADVDLTGVRFCPLVSADDTVAKLHEQMWQAANGTDASAALMLKSHTCALLAHLLREHSLAADESATMHRTQRERLGRVVKFIKENYDHPISTRALADACYLTESHFCRFFKRATGMSALEYVNNYRILRAEVLLRESDLSISQIALSCGFSDLNYFSRVYKRIKGASPARCREAARSACNAPR